MKKRLLLMLTALTLTGSLVACGSSDSSKEQKEDASSVVEDDNSTDNSSEDDEKDTSSNSLSTIYDWGCPWVEANDSRIVLNFPGQISSGAGGGKSITYDSGVAVITSNFPEDKGKISDVKEIYTTYADGWQGWKGRIKSEFAYSPVVDTKIDKEEIVEINGYTFHKVVGRATLERGFLKDGDPDKHYDQKFVYYATTTRHEGNVPLFFLVMDGTPTYRYRGEDLVSKEDVIEEYADHMAKSLREYSGGSESYTNYGVHGKDLPLH